MKKIFNLLKIKTYKLLGLLNVKDEPKEVIEPEPVKPVAKKPGRPKSENTVKKATKKQAKPNSK